MGWILYIMVVSAFLGGAWWIRRSFGGAKILLIFVSVMYAGCASLLLWQSQDICPGRSAWSSTLDGAPMGWRGDGWNASVRAYQWSTPHGTGMCTLCFMPPPRDHDAGRLAGDIALWSLPLALVWGAVLILPPPVVPLPKNPRLCQRCRYLLVGCSRPECPECGLRIPTLQWHRLRTIAAREIGPPADQ